MYIYKHTHECVKNECNIIDLKFQICAFPKHTHKMNSNLIFRAKAISKTHK